MENNSKMNRRRNNYRNYEKPQWEVEKERLEKEKEERDARNMEQTEENFPALGKVVPRAVTWTGAKFKDLASDWKAQEDEKKAVEAAKAAGESPVTPDGFVMPKFNLNRHYVEADEPPAPPPTQVVSEEEDSAWTTVDHSAKTRARMERKQKRLEEKLRRLDEGEESESEHDADDENDDTCWGDGSDYHTPAGKTFNS